MRFDNVGYSVPRSSAFQTVSVKGYVDRVEVVAAGQVIARHARSYEAGRQVLDPRHYLATLSRKPACLDHAPVYRDWQLPPVFLALRERLEAEHGPHAGARQYIRVLMLLNEHPVERVRAVLDRFVAGEAPSVEVIITRTQGLRDRAGEPSGRCSDLPSSVPALQVPMPDLRRFNLFLSSGGPPDVRESVAVAQDESQAAPAAHDLCRV